MPQYKAHFIAPNRKVPPRPEGETFESEYHCERWCNLLNDSSRGVAGHYKALPIKGSLP